MRTFDVKSLGEVVLDRRVRTPGEVAVIVPLYNYEQYIVECLQSVFEQTIEPLSIIVVDDCSTDHSLDLAVAFLGVNAERFSSVQVIRHRKNQGLSMTRNSGIAWSTEPLLFMLDADNLIRPPTLARLKSALDTDKADFAYSQLFIFGAEARIGDADIWHIDRIRLGNTIDAMALIRRSALERAGGYSVLADDHGWEDYDLWCRFFMLGLRGVFLPELLCEYRRHGRSMLQMRTNTNLDALYAEMALRYPEIFNRAAQLTPVEEDYAVGIPLRISGGRHERSPRIAVIVHLFAEHLAAEIFSYLKNIPYPFDLFVSTDTNDKKARIEEQSHHLRGSVEIRITPRRGRDIAPRLIGFKDVYERYEYVLLLHSKVSQHASNLDNWRPHLLQHLVGSQEIVHSIFTLFEEIPELGVIAGQHFEPIRQHLGWGENFEKSKSLAARLGVDLRINGHLDYPSGSMLWARTAALRPFFDARLSIEDFDPDNVGRQLDGTMAHAVERLFFIAAEKADCAWIKVALPKLLERRDTIKWFSDADELREFIRKRRRILLDPK